MKKQKIKLLTGERWENDISNKEKHLSLMPKICEAILYSPQLSDFFIKLHKKHAILNDKAINACKYEFKEFSNYNVYNYNDVRLVLGVLLEAENNEDLRTDIFKKFSQISIYTNYVELVNDIRLVKCTLDCFLIYYYNWLFFLLPTKKQLSEEELYVRKKIITNWESYYENKLSTANAIDSYLINIPTNKNISEYEKVLVDIFIKKQFKYISFVDFFEMTFRMNEYINDDLNLECFLDICDSNFNPNLPVFNQDLEISNELDVLHGLIKEVNEVDSDNMSFQENVESFIKIYYTMAHHHGRDVLKLLQSNCLKKEDIKKIVHESLAVVSILDDEEQEEYFDYIFSINTVCNLFSLIQEREREKYLDSHYKIFIKDLNNKNHLNSEKKLREIIENKNNEIEKLKTCLEQEKEKVKKDLIDYKRHIKEQNKIIYDLEKKAEETEREKINNRKIQEEKHEKKQEVCLPINSIQEKRIFTEEEFREIIENNIISIYGGAPKWQVKIKNKYPELNMFEASDSTPLRSLDKSFMIVYVNIWTSHSSWERVVSYLESSNIPKCHLNNYNERFLWQVVITEYERISREIKEKCVG